MSQEAIARIANEGTWYHSFSFPNGVEASGTYDYRSLVTKMAFPPMEGATILDVGCSDGFFSYYFATTCEAKHVTGIDSNPYTGEVGTQVLENRYEQYKKKYQRHHDWPLLSEEYKALGLRDGNKFNFIKHVYRVGNMDFAHGSIYNLAVFPKADVVFCGSLLEHLKDPITAIENLYSRTRSLCIIDVSSVIDTFGLKSKPPLLRYTAGGGSFFHFSVKAVALMMESCGFRDVSMLSSYRLLHQRTGRRKKNVVLAGRV